MKKKSIMADGTGSFDKPPGGAFQKFRHTNRAYKE